MFGLLSLSGFERPSKRPGDRRACGACGRRVVSAVHRIHRPPSVELEKRRWISIEGDTRTSGAPRSRVVCQRGASFSRIVPLGRGSAPSFGPEAVAGDDDLVGVVRQAVEGGGGEERALEQVRPLGEGAVAGDDERALLVALVDDLVEVLGAGRVQGLQSEVIEDEEVAAHVGGETAFVGAVGAAAVEVRQHPRCRDEQNVEASAAGFVTERLGEVALADAGGAPGGDRLVALDETGGGEGADPPTGYG